MNTLTTDKVYYSPEGKFFVSEREWPTMPSLNNVVWAETNMLAYQQGINKCIEQGYSIESGHNEIFLELVPNGAKEFQLRPGTIYTLPEPREFEVRTQQSCDACEIFGNCNTPNVCSSKRIAVLLPKKTAPLCMGTKTPSVTLFKEEEQKPDYETFIEMTSNVPVSNDKQSEEQKDIWNDIDNNYIEWRDDQIKLSDLLRDFEIKRR